MGLGGGGAGQGDLLRELNNLCANGWEGTGAKE